MIHASTIVRARLLVLGIGLAGLSCGLGCGPKPPSDKPSSDEPSPPSTPEAPTSTPLFRRLPLPPELSTLETGAAGEHWLVETMLGGLGWIDHDGDGDLDLYLCQGHDDPRHAARPGRQRNRLLRNEGGGRFVDDTERSGTGDRRYSNGLAVADYDADGDQDLLVTNFGRNTLYENRGDGSFEDVTEAAGLAGEEGYSTSAVWFDCDGDRDLDLYVARYLVYRPGSSRECHEGSARVYCHPRFFRGEADLLYENLGAGRFRERGGEAGIARAGPNSGKGLGVIAFDCDGDGDQDLYVANDTTPNFLWKNDGRGHFVDDAPLAGVAYDANGRSQAGMGLDWADLAGDGRPAILVTNYSRETNALYRPTGDGAWEDAVHRFGLAASFPRVGFGCAFADFDLDGHLDLVVANGHVDDSVEDDPTSEARYRQEPDLFLGTAGGGFAHAPAARAGRIFGEGLVGRGLAPADYDNDGDVDLALASLDRGLILLENRSVAAERSVRIELRGRAPNRDALGARLELRLGERRLTHHYQSARSYCSAVDPRLVVALGDSERMDEVRVTWTSGEEQSFGPLEAGRHVLEEVPGEARDPLPSSPSAPRVDQAGGPESPR